MAVHVVYIHHTLAPSATNQLAWLHSSLDDLIFIPKSCAFFSLRFHLIPTLSPPPPLFPLITAAAFNCAPYVDPLLF